MVWNIFVIYLVQPYFDPSICYVFVECLPPQRVDLGLDFKAIPITFVRQIHKFEYSGN